jgi:hypothetical protein
MQLQCQICHTKRLKYHVKKWQKPMYQLRQRLKCRKPQFRQIGCSNLPHQMRQLHRLRQLNQYRKWRRLNQCRLNQCQSSQRCQPSLSRNSLSLSQSSLSQFNLRPMAELSYHHRQPQM